MIFTINLEKNPNKGESNAEIYLAEQVIEGKKFGDKSRYWPHLSWAVLQNINFSVWKINILEQAFTPEVRNFHTHTSNTNRGTNLAQLVEEPPLSEGAVWHHAGVPPPQWHIVDVDDLPGRPVPAQPSTILHQHSCDTMMENLAPIRHVEEDDLVQRERAFPGTTKTKKKTGRKRKMANPFLRWQHCSALMVETPPVRATKGENLT